MVGDLADLDLVEFPSGKRTGMPANDLFLLRVTDTGRRALSSGAGASFWEKRSPRPPVVRGGPSDSAVQLHQMLTVEQVFLALQAGVEQSDASREEKEAALALIRQGQEWCCTGQDPSESPSVSHWASRNLPTLIRGLQALR